LIFEIIIKKTKLIMTKGVPLPKEAKRLIKALHDAGNSTIDSMLTIVKNTFGAECITILSPTILGVGNLQALFLSTSPGCPV
jgi:hypothetical protein